MFSRFSAFLTLATLLVTPALAKDKNNPSCPHI
jgi:hypothetical protein